MRIGLQWILDHKIWGRKKSGLIGLKVVTVPLTAAWIWEIVSLINPRGVLKKELDT